MMPAIRIDIDLTSIVAQMDELTQKQVPYATSRALNALAFEIMDEERRGVRSRFTIRRDWVVQGIRVLKTSDRKDDLTVEVGVEYDRAFLSKFELGNAAWSPSGQPFFVPTAALLQLTHGMPRASEFKTETLAFADSTTKRGKVQTKGRQRTFVVTTVNGGRTRILQRTGPGRHDLRGLYTLKPSIRIPAILKFEETARAVFSTRWVTLFRKWMDEALRTANPR